MNLLLLNPQYLSFFSRKLFYNWFKYTGKQIWWKQWRSSTFLNYFKSDKVINRAMVLNNQVIYFCSPKYDAHIFIVFLSFFLWLSFSYFQLTGITLSSSIFCYFFFIKMKSHHLLDCWHSMLDLLSSEQHFSYFPDRPKFNTIYKNY